MSPQQMLSILRIGMSIYDGSLHDPLDIARAVAGLALDLVPVDMLKDALTIEAAARADAIADLAEEAKLA